MKEPDTQPFKLLTYSLGLEDCDQAFIANLATKAKVKPLQTCEQRQAINKPAIGQLMPVSYRKIFKAVLGLPADRVERLIREAIIAGV